MSSTSSLVLGIVLLLGNAFFVASEFAMVSARPSKVEPMAANGSRLARTTLKAMDQLSYLIAAAQFGITVCSLGLGAIAEPALAHLIEPAAHAVGLPDSWLHPVALSISMLIVIYLHVVLGEMVPKNVALAGPERSAMIFGPPMLALVTVLKPLVLFLDWVADLCIKLLRVEPRSSMTAAYTREEVGAFVDESRAEGLLEQGEYERLSGAIGFTTRAVSEIAMPLAQLHVVRRGARADEVEQVCAATGYSRFPVADDEGELIGYLHIKDTLQVDPHGRARAIEDKWIRPFASVRPSDTLVDALKTLQAKGAHMARVVDDAGVVIGVVTLEDVIEELVGEIRDAAHAEGH
ncbi:MAG TPA: hemolysin family protein [Marmoricola sp.]|nr:hemolysin family protein [Marmoricola sp.]HNN47526.1 hemolysin family protein [Marmoricola sp.]HNO39162.1 hemolysin family protein [Marmoricola sp.]